jgi:hypothetical protein
LIRCTHNSARSVLGEAMFSNSFAGIAPVSAPGFVLAELIGAAIGLTLHTVFESGGQRKGHPNVLESSGEKKKI